VGKRRALGSVRPLLLKELKIRLPTPSSDLEVAGHSGAEKVSILKLDRQRSGSGVFDCGKEVKHEQEK
jgi:hypothetical protein